MIINHGLGRSRSLRRCFVGKLEDHTARQELHVSFSAQQLVPVFHALDVNQIPGGEVMAGIQWRNLSHEIGYRTPSLYYPRCQLLLLSPTLFCNVPSDDESMM